MLYRTIRTGDVITVGEGENAVTIHVLRRGDTLVEVGIEAARSVRLRVHHLTRRDDFPKVTDGQDSQV